MDKQQRRAVFTGLEKVDAIAFARAIAQIDILRMARSHLGGKRLPFGDDDGGLGNGEGIVQPAIALFLRQLAPIRGVDGRVHGRLLQVYGPCR